MEDQHTCGKKMARKGRTEVIYKGTFVSNRSLLQSTVISSYIIVIFEPYLTKPEAMRSLPHYELLNLP